MMIEKRKNIFRKIYKYLKVCLYIIKASVIVIEWAMVFMENEN